MLKSVPIKKYSANCSRLNSGYRAIDFAANINPAVAGECSIKADKIRNRSSHPINIPALLSCACDSLIFKSRINGRVNDRIKYPAPKITAT